MGQAAFKMLINCNLKLEIIQPRVIWLKKKIKSKNK